MADLRWDTVAGYLYGNKISMVDSCHVEKETRLLLCPQIKLQNQPGKHIQYTYKTSIVKIFHVNTTINWVADSFGQHITTFKGTTFMSRLFFFCYICLNIASVSESCYLWWLIFNLHSASPSNTNKSEKHILTISIVCTALQNKTLGDFRNPGSLSSMSVMSY